MNQVDPLHLPALNECREKVFGDKTTITKRLDENCPWCHAPVLFKQIVYKGKKPRPPFKGCSNFPHCSWTDYKDPVK